MTAPFLPLSRERLSAGFVIADAIRNPECAWHWMPDQSLPRARSGVRHDKGTIAISIPLGQLQFSDQQLE